MMIKRNSTRQSKTVRVSPGQNELDEMQKRLPRFEPFDLRQLLIETKDKHGQARTAAAMDVHLEALKASQIRLILKALKVKENDAHLWKKAFLRVCYILLGLGHLGLSLPKRNRNAAGWTIDNNLMLTQAVRELRARGESEAEALRQLTGDSRFESLYRPQNRYRNDKGNGKEAIQARRVQALEKRYYSLKRNSGGLKAAVAPDFKSELEEIIAMFEWQLAQSFGKLKRP